MTKTKLLRTIKSIVKKTLISTPRRATRINNRTMVSKTRKVDTGMKTVSMFRKRIMTRTKINSKIIKITVGGTLIQTQLPMWVMKIMIEKLKRPPRSKTRLNRLSRTTRKLMIWKRSLKMAQKLRPAYGKASFRLLRK